VRVFVALLACLALPAGVSADLKKAMAEDNLEKRSRLALQNAEQALKAAHKAYEGGDLQQTKAKVEEVLASVELADESLWQTGKNPRRKPKHFKHAEKETRDLLRGIESLENYMSYTDRPVIEKLKKRTIEVHDGLLAGIMGEKR
jgi:hypothetical protein